MKPENLVLGRTTGGEPPRLHLVDLGLSAFFVLCCFWHCCQCWLPASGCPLFAGRVHPPVHPALLIKQSVFRLLCASCKGHLRGSLFMLRALKAH